MTSATLKTTAAIHDRTLLIADVMLREAKAIQDAAADRGLVAAIDAAATMIAHSAGPLIVAGIGKSGHVAKKIVASFCSLGKPAIFLHAAEASHGDLGIVGADSALLMLSNSGETGELSDILAYAQTYGNPMIGLTANAESTLGRAANLVLAYGRQAEACRNGLAPTTSTAVALAIGDALAVAVSDILDFRPEDFRRFHPGGKLGARLAKAEALMLPIAACPTIAWDAPGLDAALAMAASGAGFALIRSEINDAVIGILPGSALALDQITGGRTGLLSASASELGDLDPLVRAPNTPAQEALRLMLSRKRDAALVRNESGALLGVLRTSDCG